jgi:hypothetical protein
MFARRTLRIRMLLHLLLSLLSLILFHLTALLKQLLLPLLDLSLLCLSVLRSQHLLLLPSVLLFDLLALFEQHLLLLLELPLLRLLSPVGGTLNMAVLLDHRLLLHVLLAKRLPSWLCSRIRF